MRLKEDAPLNATGAGVAMPPTKPNILIRLLRRSKKKKSLLEAKATMVIPASYGNDYEFSVWKNPGPDTVKAIWHSAKDVEHKIVKTLRDDHGNHWVWDGSRGHHGEVARALNSKNYDDDGWVSHEGIGKYFIRAHPKSPLHHIAKYLEKNGLKSIY